MLVKGYKYPEVHVVKEMRGRKGYNIRSYVIFCRTLTWKFEKGLATPFKPGKVPNVVQERSE